MSEEVGGLTDLSNRRNVLVHSFPYLHINILQKKKKKEKEKKERFCRVFLSTKKGCSADRSGPVVTFRKYLTQCEIIPDGE